ncbi:MAG: hypothetical protein KJN62_03840, partial [Deltaproteobacteria bacterium]|nr:hypothetical protein [Deltaproteobacteria bacterium]
GHGSDEGNTNLVFRTSDAGVESEQLRIAYDGTVTLQAVANAGTDPDKFLCWDASGNVDYRTGTNMLSDLSGNATSTFDWNDNELDNINTITFSNTESEKYLFTCAGDPNTGLYIKNYDTFYFEIDGNTVLAISRSSGIGTVGVSGTFNTTNLYISSLAVYANNSAAISGGLSAGEVYRTSTGNLMIVY